MFIYKVKNGFYRCDILFQMDLLLGTKVSEDNYNSYISFRYVEDLQYMDSEGLSKLLTCAKNKNYL